MDYDKLESRISKILSGATGTDITRAELIFMIIEVFKELSEDVFEFTEPYIDPYGNQVITLHANKDLHHEDFFIRNGATVLLSTTMRTGLRKMFPMGGKDLYLRLPVLSWEKTGIATIEPATVEIMECLSGDPSPFIHFLKENAGEELVGAEIGVLKGSNALNMLEALPIKRLSLIDPYTSNQEYVDSWPSNYEDLKEAEQEAQDCLKPFEEKTDWIREKAVDVFRAFPDNFFDFLYLDGDKTYHNFTRELEVYTPKMKPGGIIGGHDYTNTYIKLPTNEVKTVVDQYVISHGISRLYHANQALQWWWQNERAT